MKHGDTCISKGPPLQWLLHFLSHHNPSCSNKCVHPDQVRGGKLFDHPEVLNLFAKKGHLIHPTGSDNSCQNGPVERRHRTLVNTVQVLLLGANLDVEFWPCAFCHALCMSNKLPEPSQLRLPLALATDKKEDSLNIQTFRCRVWVSPPGHRAAKLCPNSWKGIFLGCLPHATQNILWHNIETTEIKIATHA